MGYVGCMNFPQSIRQGDTGRCDQTGLSGAGKWTNLSPWRQAMQWSLHDWARLDQSKVPRLADILLPYFRFCHCKAGPDTYDKVRGTT